MTGLLHEPSSSTPEPTTSKALVSRTRAIIVHATLVVFALSIVARAGQVQLIESNSWAGRADDQHIRDRAVTPPRGQIVDASGNVFVESRELIQVTLTPKNFRRAKRSGAKKSDKPVDTRVVVRQVLKSLNVSDAVMKKAMDSTRKWVELPELYLPSDVQRLSGLPGVTLSRKLKRVITASPGLRGLLGVVRDENSPSGGLEQELDTLLRGTFGRDARMADGRGNYVETPSLSGVDARPGHSITLTINQSLQEIAERELAEGISRTGSTGGDVVIMDPRDGAVLALAGVRDGKPSNTATGIAEPYEPGSVMKPFVVARALDLDRVEPDDMINTEGGSWVVAKRKLTDEHKAASMSVKDVIRLSSNIGAVKIAMELSEGEEYEALRDFGFGTLTGVPYPAESRGVLPAPKWHAMVASSVAMGYGMSATALQIAAAYCAIANNGDLLQPVLVREVRDADGNVVYAHERRVIRHAMSAETATLMRTVLASVVDSGTAVAADMATYDVAGKSGTARRSEDGRYDRRSYNSTFAGMFPAQAPQYVLVVRLIDPQKNIFGGTVAGRVVNVILQNALATRDASLDRGALAAVSKPLPVKPARPLTPKAIELAERDTARFDSLRAPAPPPAPAIAAPTRVVISLPLKVAKGGGRAIAETDGIQSGELRAVPSVYGLDTRQATRALHAAGFHVTLAAGKSARTKPSAGTLMRAGALVVLETPQ